MAPTDPWVRRSVDHPTGRVIILPFAGGGTAEFTRWKGALGDRVEILPVCYPAREARMSEAPIRTMRAMAGRIADALWPLLDVPTVIYGHSLGSWVGYEVVRQWQREGKPLPRALVVGARWAPTRPNKREPLYALPDAEFVARVNALYGAIPEVLLKRPKVLQMFLPALKGDFAVLDTYRHVPGDPIRIPIHVLDGSEDPVVGPGEAATWSEVATAPCTVTTIQGGHFFFRDDPDAVFAVLRKALAGG